MAVYKIALDKRSGTGGTDAIWYDTISALFYGDVELTEPLDIVTKPTRECWKFNGFFSSTSGGTQYIDENGNITDALREPPITAAKTIYALWTRVSYKLTLSDNNGSGGSGALFWKIDTEETDRLYSDDLCTTPASSVSRPSRSAYAFEGYYNGTSTLGSKYVNADGSFTEALTGLSLTGDKTIYARWIAAFKITVSANSGTGGTTSFYYDSVSQKFYDGPDLLNEITAIVPHVRSQYAFLGCMATNSDTGVMRVNPDGSIVDGWIPTASATIYARWTQVSWKVTISKNSGTGGTDFIFAKIGATTGRFFADDLCTEAISSVELPTRSGYVIKGVYNNTSGSNQYIDRNGNFTDYLQALSITSNITIYAQWIAVFKLKLSKSSGAGGTDALYYNALDDSFFLDADLTIAASSIEIPVRECYRFKGFYNSASGYTQYIDGSGQFTDALRDLSITSAKTFYAQWELVSYKLTLNDNGGDGGSGAIYFDGANNAFFADYMLTERVTSVIAPVRQGYDFIGYYSTSAASGGSRYIDESGRILVSTPLAASVTVYARWSPRTYTLMFNYNGGGGSVNSKPVTMGAAIGSLPSATNPGVGIFDGWYVGEKKITSSSLWTIPEDSTAVAKWRYYFGNLTDWFVLETANGPLMLVASTDGATRSVTETSHTGALAINNVDSSVGAFNASGILMNPVCTYRIRKPGRVNINLGVAWSGSGTSKSGYMLVSAEYATAADGEPVLVVRGVANEGAAAINRWSVTLDVNPDHIAQDPMGAIRGGGELTECKTLITCDPVVPYENGMPCASDIVHGKVVVTATTNAYSGETAPTAAGSFVESNGVPTGETDVDFTTFSITAERSL